MKVKKGWLCKYVGHHPVPVVRDSDGNIQVAVDGQKDRAMRSTHRQMCCSRCGRWMV